MSRTLDAIRGVPNATELVPNLLTGGQPAAEHLRAFKEAGGSLVLDLRDPMEPRPLDEPALAGELQLDYVNVPVVAGTLEDATLERILAVVRGARERPILVHCGSGSRVGAALIPYLMLDLHMEEEDAMGQAMRVGLRSAELLAWGLDYGRRKRGEAGGVRP